MNADELGEHLDHPTRTDTAGYIDRQALAGVFVDDDQAVTERHARPKRFASSCARSSRVYSRRARAIEASLDAVVQPAGAGLR